jgi:serine/threonine protein kinase
VHVCFSPLFLFFFPLFSMVSSHARKTQMTHTHTHKQFASRGVTPEFMMVGGSPHWTAPEILLGTSDVSGATDVYALANVLFEIATRTLPFSEELHLTAVVEHIKAGRRPTWPPCPALEAASGSDERAKVAACEVAKTRANGRQQPRWRRTLN